MATSLAGEGVRSAFAAALALGEEVGDPTSQFLARTGLWGFHFARAELIAAAALADELTALAERLALPPFWFVAHALSGVGSFLAGDLAIARARLEAALATGVELPPSVRPSVNSLAGGFLSATLALIGFPDEARRLDAASRERAGARGDAYDHANVLLYSAQLHMILRDVPATAAAVERAASLAADHEFAQIQAIARLGRGWCDALTAGDPDKAREIDAGLADLQGLGLLRARPSYLALASEVRLRGGEIAAARAALDEAQAAVNATGERFHAAELERLQGECHWPPASARPRRRGGAADRDAREAERRFESALEIARRQGARWWELRTATSLARLLAETGRRAAARALLRPLCEGFIEGSDTADLRDARSLLERGLR
jgi:predicted ATPase